jgi:transcription termination factor Rho
MAERKKELKIEKEAVDTIYAEHVECTKSGVQAINSGTADISHSGIGFLRAQTVTQNNCGNAFIHARTLKTDSVKSIITIADNIQGDVNTVLDKKGAAVFGLVFASVFILFRILRRLRG